MDWTCNNVIRFLVLVAPASKPAPLNQLINCVCLPCFCAVLHDIRGTHVRPSLRADGYPAEELAAPPKAAGRGGEQAGLRLLQERREDWERKVRLWAEQRQCGPDTSQALRHPDGRVQVRDSDLFVQELYTKYCINFMDGWKWKNWWKEGQRSIHLLFFLASSAVWQASSHAVIKICVYGIYFISLSLSLFFCLWYSGILVQPQWKHFRHIRMLKNDRYRLSNGIWRSWHMQCEWQMHDNNIYLLTTLCALWVSHSHHYL